MMVDMSTNQEPADMLMEAQFLRAQALVIKDLRVEVERLRATLANLEHPGGRPCPWCLTPTGFVHGRHCELATVLGFDKE